MAGDRHYTPPHIADAVASAVDWSALRSFVVADFAAGGGALLQAAARVHQDLALIATDADNDVVRALRRAHPEWRVGKCDFLDRRSVASSSLAGQRGPKVHVVVLNPPFTCRGSQVIETALSVGTVRSSVALSFVLRSLERVGADGQVAALLPESCLRSEKDERAWQAIGRVASVQVVGEFGRHDFVRAHAKSVVVHLKRRAAGSPTLDTVLRAAEPVVRKPCSPPALTLLRGRYPMHLARPLGYGISIVHTTNLRDGRVNGQRIGSAPIRYAVKGPLLLVPRVGLVGPQKICLLATDETIVMSDCVFALAGGRPQLEAARERILERWRTFEACFGGSCAPYTTTRRLWLTLLELGIAAGVEPRLQKRFPAELGTSRVTEPACAASGGAEADSRVPDHLDASRDHQLRNAVATFDHRRLLTEINEKHS